MTSILRNIWSALIDFLMAQLAKFSGGANWQQEDKASMVIPERHLPQESQSAAISVDNTWRTLAEFSLPSELGNEREAMRRVSQAVEELSLSTALLDRLKTAVAEATMNAIEHGNKNKPELPVVIQIDISATALLVRITDQGGGGPISEPETPNLEAKLSGLQTPRGWGLFLIKMLMDEMHVISNDTHHTVELILYLEKENYAS